MGSRRLSIGENRKIAEHDIRDTDEYFFTLETALNCNILSGEKSEKVIHEQEISSKSEVNHSDSKSVNKKKSYKTTTRALAVKRIAVRTCIGFLWEAEKF